MKPPRLAPLRLAILAQRFWPRVGSVETRVGQLACGLADHGVEVTIVTARWHCHWPAEIYYHGIPVVRLDPPPSGRWSTWRWTRSLARWMQRRADQFDLVCIWGLMHEARAAMQAVGSQLPLVLVPERTGWHGDCFRQVHVSGGRGIKSACLRARAFVANSPAARRELQAAGYPRERIHDVPMGVPRSPPRTYETQSEARSLLAESNAALQLAMHAPLVVSTSRLEVGRGWEQLLAAWSIVARQKVAARLWLAGEVPAAVAQRIEALGLGGRVGLVGMFDDVECLLAAADVHVTPAVDGSPQSILEAMGAGAPSVAIDVPLNRWLLGDDAAGLVVPPENAAALATAILRLLDDPVLASRLGAAAWQRAETEFDLTKMVEKYLELFESICAQA
ncbi:MAG: glycosyltransferase family 4 protein [Thermoguttaceae bacterium]